MTHKSRSTSDSNSTTAPASVIKIKAIGLGGGGQNTINRMLAAGIEGNIERVVITELRGSTYYAILQVAVAAREVDVDSRPSDAIAVAIRTGAPLFASEAVLESASDPDRAPAIDAQWRPDIDEWPKHRTGAELSH